MEQKSAQYAQIGTVTRHAARVALILWVIIPLLGAVLYSWDECRHRPLIWVDGDGALLELNTVDAQNFKQLTGPYSRFGWSHPGPLFFYVMLPFYSCFGHNVSALAVGTSIFHLFLGIFLVWVSLVKIMRHSFPFAVSLLLVCGLYFRYIPLSSYWNPRVLAIPFLIILIVSPFTVYGSLWALPVIVLLGSFIVQTHLSVLPCTIAVIAGAIGFAVVGALVLFPARFAKKRVRAWVWVVLLVFGICWSLPVFGEVTDGGWNLARITNFFVQSYKEQSFWQAVNAVSQQISWAEITLGATSQHLTIVASVIAGAQMVCLVVFGIVASGSRRSIYEASISSLVLTVAAASIWSTCGIRGELHGYLISWMASIGCILYALPLSGIIGSVWAAALGSRAGRSKIELSVWPQNSSKSMEIGQTRHRLLGFVQLLVFMTSGALTVYSLAELHCRLDILRKRPAEHIEYWGNMQVKNAAECLIDSLRIAGIENPVLHWDHPSWVLAAGVLLQLKKGGQPFSVSPPWVFMVGRNYRIKGNEDGLVYLFMAKPAQIFDAAAVHTIPLPDGTESDYDHHEDLLVIVPPGSLSLPQTIKFDTSRNGFDALIQVGGWSNDDGEGVWTEGREARLLLPVSRTMSADLILELGSVAFVNQAHPKLKVDMIANGEPIGSQTFRHGKPQTDWKVMIPSCVLNRRRLLEILFRIDDPASPASLGISRDPRLLGMRLKSLTFREISGSECGGGPNSSHADVIPP